VAIGRGAYGPGTRYKKPGSAPCRKTTFSTSFMWATDARNYTDEFVSIERAQNTNYYKGRLPT